MRLELTGRHVDITPALRRLVDRKLAKLERLLNDSVVSAQTVLTREKHRHRADICLHARGEKFLHGVGDSGSWEASLADAVEKITQQAQKVKGKWQGRKRRGGARVASAAPVFPAIEDAGTREASRAPGSGDERRRRERVRMPRILRASRQTIRAMSLADAARQVDAADDGLLVFHDVETATISVLYRRQNGELTLVQTQS
jgi:putative sigma-54 modulation protein